MSDQDLVYAIMRWGSYAAIFLAPCLALWHFFWKESLIDVWTIYRLRVARRVRRAAYIRWWRGAAR